MLTTFALHPAASKHLIAKAVSNLPEVQTALEKGKIFIGTGTTNIEIAEQLLNQKFEQKEYYVAGVVTQNVACATEPEKRKGPWCIDKGNLIQTDWLEFVNEFTNTDVFIKGANAVDPFGNVGILLADQKGGTIGQSIGILKARGIPIITPVGLEKLIPSCAEADKILGIHKSTHSLGLKVGYMVVSNTKLMTEIQSIKTLFDIDTVHVGSGGVGGMEGAVILAAECEEKKAKELLNFIKQANKKSPLKINKKSCKLCQNQCNMH